MTSREEFLERVRRQTGPGRDERATVATPQPADPADSIAARRERARRDLEALLARFWEEAGRVSVACHRVATIGAAADAVLTIARAQEVRRVATWGRRALGLVQAVAVHLRKAGLDVAEGSPDEVTPETAGRLRDLVARADLGLTAADLAIAETGSLVVVSGAGKGRSVSLLPPIHVVVFGRDQLILDLAEAGTVLEAWHRAAPVSPGANVAIITGPSRTADIELTLTRGVHGPREVHAVFVDSL